MAVSAIMASLRARLGGNSRGINSYEYESLEDGNQRRVLDPSASVWSRQNRRLLKLSLAAVAIVTVAFMAVVYGRLGKCDNIECTEISRLWGQYSPAFSVRSQMAAGIPAGCEITFAQVLSRHGARDPTLYKTTVYNQTISRIQSSATKYGSGHKFLRNYEYTLGANELTLFGENQMRESGRHASRRYNSLILRKGKGAIGPFVRSSGQSRVIMSANNWTHGFFDELERSRREEHGQEGDGGMQRPRDSSMLIIPELPGVNNTLSHGLCDEFESGEYSWIGAKAQAQWMDVFVPPIRDRLNKNLPGVGLTRDETIYLMDMCPFETVASAVGKLSPFCSLFTVDEWESYDYFQSLGKYYGYASGNPLGPTQGVGFVNELIARLTGKPVVDHTSVNATLDASPEAFPLDRHLYADFSHDNDMMTVYGALGLYNTSDSVLPMTRRVPPLDAGGFSSAWTVPFAARMYVEKMMCPYTGHEEFVRVLINDRVVPMPGCSDALGRCRLSAFVDSLQFAQSGGAWDQCFKTSERD